MTLEQRIVDALSTREMTAEALVVLVAATEAAIAQAAQAAESERVRAHDPALSPDPVRARKAMEDAAFAAERLRTQLPRLQARYRATLSAERVAAWTPTYEAAAAEQAALAEELAALYQPFIVRFTDLMLRIEQHRAIANAVNAAKPSACHGDGRRLDDQIGGHIRRDLKLPAWDPKAGLAWPPYRPIDPAMVTPVVRGDWRLTTGRWHEVHRERAEAVREQAKRTQQEEQARIDADPRADQWWKVQPA